MAEVGRAALLAAALALLASPVRAGSFDLFGGGRLVAYTPRGWDPTAGRPPGPASLRADADELRRRAFRAVVTIGTHPPLAAVCRVFKRRGFRTVVLGVSDPRDATQLRTAEKLRRCADGYVVGDGGLGTRYARDDLAAAVRRLRATGRPVTVREPLAAYDGLADLRDWLFPLVDPFAQEAKHPQEACGWTIRRWLELTAKAPPGMPAALAGVAFPSAGHASARETYQRAFFLCIETRAVRYEHFEAFDQPWREGPTAAHLGLFRSDGTPKMLMATLAMPAVTLRSAGRRARGRVRNAAPERFRVVVYTRGERWEAGPTTRFDRRGRWKAAVPAGRAAVALLVAREHVPPPAADRLPQVDNRHVFAASAPAP